MKFFEITELWKLKKEYHISCVFLNHFKKNNSSDDIVHKLEKIKRTARKRNFDWRRISKEERWTGKSNMKGSQLIDCKKKELHAHMGGKIFVPILCL